jgi:hypothetical protein
MAVNQTKCQEVLDYLLSHPERHVQRYWGRDWKRYRDFYGETFEFRHCGQKYPQADQCGTTMCIAGTVMMLAGRLSYSAAGVEKLDGHAADRGEWIAAAAEELGIEFSVAEDIFLTMDNDEALHKLKELCNG